MRVRSCSSAAKAFVRPSSSTTVLTGRRCQSVRLRTFDEIDPQGAFGLAYLPVLPTFPLQPFAESAYLIGERLVRGGACQKAAHRADAVWRGLLLYQLRSQEEFPELLERGFQFSQRSPSAPGDTTAMPWKRWGWNRHDWRPLADSAPSLGSCEGALGATCQQLEVTVRPAIGALLITTDFPALAAGAHSRLTRTWDRINRCDESA